MFDDKESLIKYFLQLKNGTYLMDAFSKSLPANRGSSGYSRLEEINYASLDNLFDKENDLLLFFYNSSTCSEQCQKVKKTIDQTLIELKRNNIEHVFGAFFETNHNSMIGLGLEKEAGPVIRFYRQKEIEDFSQLDINNAEELENVLTFVMDMSSVHIDIDHIDL